MGQEIEIFSSTGYKYTSPKINSTLKKDLADYYQSMKSKNKFLTYTYQIMKDKVNDAIYRAEALEQFHSKPVKPSHLHCPCTKVHHLVKELMP